MKSPFKVMSTAALAAAVAVPTLSVPAADAAETSSFHSVALETEDGSVKTVPFPEYAKAKTFGTGELGEFVTENDVVAVSAEEGTFVSVRTLALAKIESPDADTAALLADLDDSEDNLVAEEDVAEYTEFGEPEVVAPAVESVSAINLKQLEVELSGDFDAEAAVKAENYALENFEVGNVTLDGNTATLTLTGDADNQDEDTLTVDSSVTGEEGEWDVEFFDTTIPEVTSASAVGSNTVKVKFSEPVNFDVDEDGVVSNSDQEDAFELNDGSTFVRSVTPLNNNTEANVEFYSELEEGENTITVSSALEDYAGYSLVSDELSFDVEVDEDAPEIVGASDVKPRSVTLQFNEDIQFADGSTELTSDSDLADIFHTNTSNVAESAKIEGNEMHITFGSDQELPNGTAYVYVDGGAVVDLWGNENTQQLREDVSVEVDEDAPEITDVEVKSGSQDQFVVTFDEEVEEDSAEEEDNYTLLDENGDEQDIRSATRQGDNNNEVLIELDAEAYGDSTLVVDNVEDVYGNATDSEDISFNFDDVTDPVFSDFDVNLYDENETVQRVVVDFKERMATEGKYSVLDLDKYVVDGTNLGDLTGVQISTVDNGSKVEIEYDTDEKDENGDFEFVNSDSVTIARVADAAGNPTSALTSEDEGLNGAGLTLDTVSTFGSASAVATDRKTIEVTLDQTVDSFEKEDFAVVDTTNNDAELEVADTDIDGDVVTITLDSPIGFDAENEDLSVVTRDQLDNDYEVETENRYGAKVSITSETVTDGIAPALAVRGAEDEADVEYIADQDTVVLTFTEDIKESSLSTTTFNVDGYTVDSATVVNGNEVHLAIADADSDLEEGVNIDQEAALTDAEGNRVTGITTEINFENNDDTVAPDAVTATSADQNPEDDPEVAQDITSIDLTWTASSSSDVTGYDIYRYEGTDVAFDSANGEIASDVDAEAYSDDTITEDQAYTYYIVAKDGTHEVESNAINFTATDVDNAPAQVSTFDASDETGTSNVNLSWDASAETDFDHYELYQGTSDQGTVVDENLTSETAVYDATGEDGNVLDFAVYAVDSAGNKSEVATTTVTVDENN